MNYKTLMATLIASTILFGCKTTESVKIVDRKVFVPRTIVTYCGSDIVKKCGKIINNNKDLVECYLYYESKIDEVNSIIKLCKKKIERTKKNKEE